MPLPRKDTELPLGLSDLLFFRVNFSFLSFSLNFSLKTQLPFFDESWEASTVPWVSCAGGSCGRGARGRGAGSTEHAILRLAPVAHGAVSSRNCQLQTLRLRKIKNRKGSFLRSLLAVTLLCCIQLFSQLFSPPGDVPGSVSSGQGKALYLGAKSSFPCTARRTPFLQLPGAGLAVSLSSFTPL